MQITYKNKKLERICTNASVAEKEFGLAIAAKIQSCIDMIKAAPSVDILVKNRIKGCHRLQGDRKGQYSMHLVEPHRLIFTVTGIEVEVAQIKEIVDYH